MSELEAQGVLSPRRVWRRADGQLAATRPGVGAAEQSRPSLSPPIPCSVTGLTVLLGLIGADRLILKVLV